MAEIHRLEQRRDDLLERIQGVQVLEADRAAVVRLFEELANRLPRKRTIKLLNCGGTFLP